MTPAQFLCLNHPTKSDVTSGIKAETMQESLSQDNFHEVVQSIDRLSASESYGAGIYLFVVSFISESVALSN